MDKRFWPRNICPWFDPCFAFSYFKRLCGARLYDELVERRKSAPVVDHVAMLDRKKAPVKERVTYEFALG